MIFRLLINDDQNSMSSITQVLHATTWDYFTSRLPDRFIRSPKVVKESIMTDIKDLVQEFWRTSSDVDVGASFFAMRRLFDILDRCFENLEVCVYINLPFLRLLSSFADKNLHWQVLAIPNSWRYAVHSPSLGFEVNSPPSDVDDRIGAKFKILIDEYRRMLDQSFSKSIDLGDILRFLPGVVVQKHMNMQGMGHLYRIEPVLLGCLVKSTIGPLKPSPHSRYILDDYLSGFLQDRDRSQLYYCDPMLQHISICRHFLSLLDEFNAFDLQS